MKRNQLAAIVLLAGGFAWAPHARADLISVGVSNGGPILTVVNAVAATAAPTIYTNTHLAGWNVSVTIQGSPPLSEPQLSSAGIGISPSTAGIGILYVTEQDVSGPLGAYNMLSSFTSNIFQGDISSVTEATYVDQGNGQFALTTELGSRTFTSGPEGAAYIGPTPDFTGPYSITEVYTVIATGQGSVLGTITTADVPEPGSLLLLGTALFGFGMVGWSCRRRA